MSFLFLEQKFKEMEKDRIVNLRCALWRFANTQSMAAVATDEVLFFSNLRFFLHASEFF